MTIKSGPNRRTEDVDPVARAFADQSDAAMRDTKKPDDRFRDDETGDEARAELARMKEAETKRRKRNRVVGGAVAGIVAIGGVFGIGRAVSGGETEPVPEPTPTAETAPVVPGNEYPNESEEPVQPPEDIPQTIEDLDIPAEAEQWVAAFGSRFAVPDVLPTYYADQAHVDKFGVNSAIGDWFIEEYEYTTNFNSPESQLPGIKLLSVPREVGLTPDGVETLLDQDVVPMLTGYMNMTARSPGAGTGVVQNEMHKYLASNTGDYADNVDSLMSTLDVVVQQHGSDAVYEVLPFVQIEYGSGTPDPGNASILNTDKGRLVQSPTRLSENGTILGTDFRTTIRVAVTEYTSEGDPVNGYDADDQPIPEIVTLGEATGNNLPQVDLMINYDRTNEDPVTGEGSTNNVWFGQD